MAQFSCPYCSERLSETERNDRTKTVFWFARYGKQFAHTQCWLADEIAPSATPERDPAPDNRTVKRLTLRKGH
jgi:hypothetical protein